MAALTITLIGHVVGVSFGAVVTPIVPQMASTGLSGLDGREGGREGSFDEPSTWTCCTPSWEAPHLTVQGDTA